MTRVSAQWRRMGTWGHVPIHPVANYQRKSSLSLSLFLFPQVEGAVISSRPVTDFALGKHRWGHVPIVPITVIDASGA